jgi:hypothetical protein
MWRCVAYQTTWYHIPEDCSQHKEDFYLLIENLEALTERRYYNCYTICTLLNLPSFMFAKSENGPRNKPNGISIRNSYQQRMNECKVKQNKQNRLGWDKLYFSFGFITQAQGGLDICFCRPGDAERTSLNAVWQNRASGSCLFVYRASSLTTICRGVQP